MSLQIDVDELVKESIAGPKKRIVLRDRQFDEAPDNEVDYEFNSPNQFFGTHANLVPLQSAVAGPRVFYGARFINQALPLVHGEAPLVQALVDGDKEGRSFDEVMGNHAGAVRTKNHGKVKKITPDDIELEGEDGKGRKIDLFNAYPLNRKTSIHNTPTVKEGDIVKPGQLLAKSNFTDKNGTLATGMNAVVGLVPYHGRSMDDSVVISESFAGRLKSDHMYGFDGEYKRGIKKGKNHYTGIFPQKFVIDQLNKLDDEGVIKVGQTVNPGDPLILATRPRVISSQSSQLGMLSKHMRNSKSDAAILWSKPGPGVVVDVSKLKNGVKVNVKTEMPLVVGDKITFRSGAKGIVSHIIPENHMPRNKNGEPLELLLNPLSIPSRVNNSLLYELLLGKAAKKLGKIYKVPSFNQPHEKWFDMVKSELDKAGLSDVEEVFDPLSSKKLENPITVGNAFVTKLHHTAESKISSRGQGSYDSEEQPSHGGGEGAKAKRASGLDINALMSSGAYGFVRETNTLRGAKNDEYWTALRSGATPREPGESFAYHKFKALLSGSGLLSRKVPGKPGVERLGFWTDKDLAEQKPVRVVTGDIVDLNTMEPVKGGLFDEAITGGKRWGYVDLPFRVPNPAASNVVKKLLGLTDRDYRAIIAGEMPLPDHLRQVRLQKSKNRVDNKSKV